MNPRRALVSILFAGLTSLPIAAQAQAIPDAQLWLTTVDRSALFAPQPAPLHFTAAQETLPAITVNDMQQFQPIEGFGFAVTGGSAQLLMRMSPGRRTALLKQIFSTEGEGIGASYIRVSIGASDMNDHVYSYDDMPAGQTDPTLAKFSLDPDRADVIPVLKEILAINPRIKILGSPWSAPAWMKTNDDVRGGNLKPEFYAAFANYFVKYIQGMQSEGIPLTAITVENEPLNPKNTPSMVMFAEEENNFIGKFLGPAFEKAGIKTEIQVYDHNPDVASYPMSILADPVAGKYVSGTAFHLYGGDPSTLTMVHDAYPNKNLYLTRAVGYGASRLGVDRDCRIGEPRSDRGNAQLGAQCADLESRRRPACRTTHQQWRMHRLFRAPLPWTATKPNSTSLIMQLRTSRNLFRPVRCASDQPNWNSSRRRHS